MKLLDFGLAQMATPPRSGETTVSEALTERGLVVGTVAYMSPEQAQGQAVDARSDVFAFGAVLYEVLSGRRAFLGDSPFATITAVVNEEPRPLEAPAALVRIVSRCLAEQPRARPLSHSAARNRTSAGLRKRSACRTFSRAASAAPGAVSA